MPKKCPKCEAILPAGALGGLCPACLLKQGVETGPAPDSLPFQPPGVEEVARLFPQLQILSFIGKGGMGAVYQARQPELDRMVALKILPPQTAGGPGFVERFNREARALARLSHPNIVAVHEFGQAGGSPFFIMEYVDGLTLRQLEQGGKLSPAEALRIVPQICEALQFAHDEGIVHRDIKPENILIDKKGRVKIADFGIAKIIGGADMTATRHSIGTPHYMAPEQVEQPQTVDHRADIFSLGVVFYEMLTGQLPLGRFAPPSRKVQIDARLDEVVLRALEREPELRFQQAGEVKTQIDTISSTPPRPSAPPLPNPGSSFGAPPPMSPPAFSSTTPDPTRRVFAWISLGLLIVGLLGVFFPRARNSSDDAAAGFGLLCVVLALIFSILSWREKMGRVICVSILTLFGAGVVLAGVWIVREKGIRRATLNEERLNTEASIKYARLQRELKLLRTEERQLKPDDSEFKSIESDIESTRNEMNDLETAYPNLFAPQVNPHDSESIPSETGTPSETDAQPGFTIYPVNKTWAELGDAFDLSTPESAAPSVGIRLTRDADPAEVLNETTVGAPALPAGLLHLTISAPDIADTLKNTVVEVVLYQQDFAGVISWRPATNQFITQCMGRQDGKWKELFEDGLESTLTKEAAVRQFENNAEQCRQKFFALASQPKPSVAESVGALSNGIVAMGGALSQAMNQLQPTGQMSNSIAQMGGAISQVMNQLRPGGPMPSQINPAVGAFTDVNQMQRAVFEQAAQQAIMSASGSSPGASGSVTVGLPSGGPPVTLHWTKEGTNIILTTNQ